MRRLGCAALAAFLFAIGGCSSNGDNPVAVPMGQIQLHLTDAPAAFDAVNLVVEEVSANAGTGDTGWQVLSNQTTTIDLLALQNGVFTTLADARVPSGTYLQVRLKLGAGSNVVVNGVAYPLTIPSGMTSGLKLYGTFDVPADGLLSLQLDFDAARSIQQTGAGEFMLNPVVRMLPATEAGAITGIVLPAGSSAMVDVSQGGTSVASTWTGANGSFKVSVLPPGTYSVVINAVLGTQVFSNVVVTAGNTTSVGTVTFGYPLPEPPDGDGD
jgi:hypothetical protein